MSRLILSLILLLLLACSSDDTELVIENAALRMVELHHTSGQVDYDSLIYDQDQLSQIIRESTGWTDRLVFDFQHGNTSTSVFLTQNGNSSADFIRKETYNQDGAIERVEVRKEDGSLFSTNEWTYNTDGTITIEKFGAQGQLEDIETVELDQQGNHVKTSFNNGNSQVVLAYDDHPNPFYKMALQTAHFQTYSPNNQTLFQIFQFGSLFFERTYNYQYGPDGYPAEVESVTSLPNDEAETFYFYYQ